MSETYRLVFILFIISFMKDVNGVKLPDFIKKCNASDPEVSNCIKDQAVPVSRILVKGIKELHVPPMVPFHLDAILIQATKNLNIKLKNVDIYGMDSAEFPAMFSDFKAKYANMTLYFPQIKIKADYEIDGHVLVLPIKGKGPSEFEITNMTVTVSFKWKLLPDKKGILYSNCYDFGLVYDIDLMHFHLENLFNGDKALGDQMNNFVNENWREFSKDIRPAISKTILSILSSMIEGIGKLFPWTELFDE